MDLFQCIPLFFESSSEDSSDDDFFMLEDFQPIANKKNENYCEDTVVEYTDRQFMMHFRVSRDVHADLTERFQNSSHFPTQNRGGNDRIIATNHLLIFLWFAGHKTASFRDVADRFNITIGSLSRVIKRVTVFISNLSPEIIQWFSLVFSILFRYLPSLY
jgi:hypothetical protein